MIPATHTYLLLFLRLPIIFFFFETTARTVPDRRPQKPSVVLPFQVPQFFFLFWFRSFELSPPSFFSLARSFFLADGANFFGASFFSPSFEVAQSFHHLPDDPRVFFTCPLTSSPLFLRDDCFARLREFLLRRPLFLTPNTDARLFSS